MADTNDIINELQDLNVTFEFELANLVEAVDNLATEIRIAGGSDFVPGRRDAVKRIQQYEFMIKLNKDDLSKLLKSNDNNYEDSNAVKILETITTYENKIEEIRGKAHK